ncbi:MULTISPECIES: hypothetical protein [unclassified Bradyrhizobium]|uniref:hypothetical protein n=1 Tax=unclassified Bradyrhizobium TaxID=2631580 RepID=UPI00230568BC|nr:MULTISPECIES: hypothetical protein [unclassified Bradyrhizobium]
MIELTPSMLLPVRDVGTVDDFIWLMKQPVRREDLRIVSFFSTDEVDVIQRLRSAAGDQLLEAIPGQSTEKITKFVEGKVAVFIGHIEGESYVARDAASQIVGQIQLEGIAEIGLRESGMPLMLGCTSFKACQLPSGLLSPIRDTTIASQLSDFFRASTYGDMLLALGSSANPLVVTRELIKGEVNQLRIRLQTLSELEQGTKPVAFGGRLAVMVTSAPEMIKFAEAMVFWYVIAAMFGPWLWSGLKRQLPILPNPRGSFIRYISAWTGRALFFAIFAPFVFLYVAFVVLSGYWKDLDSCLEGLWGSPVVMGSLVSSTFKGFYTRGFNSPDRHSITLASVLVVSIILVVSLFVYGVWDPMVATPFVYLINDFDYSNVSITWHMLVMLQLFLSLLLFGWCLLASIALAGAMKIRLLS